MTARFDAHLGGTRPRRAHRRDRPKPKDARESSTTHEPPAGPTAPAAVSDSRRSPHGLAGAVGCRHRRFRFAPRCRILLGDQAEPAERHRRTVLADHPAAEDTGPVLLRHDHRRRRLGAGRPRPRRLDVGRQRQGNDRPGLVHRHRHGRVFASSATELRRQWPAWRSPPGLADRWRSAAPCHEHGRHELAGRAIQVQVPRPLVVGLRRRASHRVVHDGRRKRLQHEYP